MTAERLGYLGLLLLAGAGVLRLMVEGSGAPALLLAAAGVALFLVYFFRSGASVQRFLEQRSTREGGGTLLLTLFVLGSLVLINVLGTRFRVWQDVTADRLFTLAPETTRALADLEEAPKFWLFYPDGDPAITALQPVLEAAVMTDPRVTFRIVDPDQEPAEAARFDLREYASVVEVGDRFETFTGDSEEDLVTALVRAMRPQRGMIGFLRGHNEYWAGDASDQGLNDAARALDVRGYRAVGRSLMQGASLDSLDVLVIAGPRIQLEPSEMDSVLAYLNRGGRLFLMLDPENPVTFAPVLGPVGIRFVPRFLADPDLPDPQMLLSVEVSAHPAVRPLKRGRRLFPAVFPGAGEILVGPNVPGVRHASILGTGPRTTVLGDSSDAPRGRALAAAAEWKGRDGALARLVVVGDADFAIGRHIARGGNGDFFLAAVQWLNDDDALIAIRPRERTDRPVMLSRQQGRALMVLLVGVAPLLLALAGIAAWWRRR